MGWSILSDEAAESGRQQSNFPWKNKGIQWRYMQKSKWSLPYKGRVQGLCCSRCRCFANETECPILTSSTLDKCVWPWFIWGSWWKCHNSERSSKNAHCKRSMLDTMSYQWNCCDFPEQWFMLERQLLPYLMILSKLLYPAKHRSCPLYSNGSITSIFAHVLPLSPSYIIFMGKNVFWIAGYGYTVCLHGYVMCTFIMLSRG